MRIVKGGVGMHQEIIGFVRENEDGLMIVRDAEIAYWIVQQLARKRMGIRDVIARIRYHKNADILLERYLQKFATSTILGLLATTPSEWWESVPLCIGVVRVLKSRAGAIEQVFERPWYLRPKGVRETGLDHVAPLLRRT